MISSTSHPSSSSVNSTTELTAAYRPPQKDYAAAYAALQEKYGPTGYGQRTPATAPKPRKTLSAPKSCTPPSSSSLPQSLGDSSRPAILPSTQGGVSRTVKGLRSMLGSVFRLKLNGKITSLVSCWPDFPQKNAGIKHLSRRARSAMHQRILKEDSARILEIGSN
ncbi:hypothetical protein B0H13DRAFT_2003090 [Mycena leptocephala]|nr:hypothetical protein B0H13DRAFT_2003090 [Mycena leptocephala]